MDHQARVLGAANNCELCAVRFSQPICPTPLDRNLAPIVLLSDGTGNSASFWRTNLWRIFSALDLRGNDQVACYDDGVGTSSFKPLALLGGAFGIGVRRSVISLYKFACRDYRSVPSSAYCCVIPGSTIPLIADEARPAIRFVFKNELCLPRFQTDL
jgi:hypothetical protein